MQIEELKDRVIIEIEEKDIETYPAWQDTPLVRVKIKKDGKFSDIWLSVIMKNSRPRFCLSHERGYPSENKGHTTRFITTNWLDNKLPNI